MALNIKNYIILDLSYSILLFSKCGTFYHFDIMSFSLISPAMDDPMTRYPARPSPMVPCEPPPPYTPTDVLAANVSLTTLPKADTKEGK